MRVWILTGNQENWEVAVSDKVWGVREGNLKKQWDKLEKGDLLLFYAKAPIKGLIGLGFVESKFKQDKPLWPDEIKANEVIYPYRFGFDLVYYLPDSWQEKNINVADLRLPFQAGLNSLSREEAISEVLERIKTKWNVDLAGFKIEKRMEKKKEKTTRAPSIHNQIRDKLYTIGQLENFISEKEYPIDGERIDVTWRKIPRGVPTKVFEVQIGGSIHQALSKLKHSWDLWNSEPFLIINSTDKEKVNTLLGGTFHEIQGVIRIITIDRVDKLYDHLVLHKEMLDEFGL